MVNPFFVRVIVQAVSTIGKSIWKAYKGVIIDNVKKTAQNARNSGGGQQGNPFSEFMNKTLQGANLVPHPLTREDALRILDLTESEAEPIEAESIMRKYYQLFLKNNPLEGGSFYLQAKIYHSKTLLMEEFADQEEELKKLLDEEFELYKAEEVKPEENPKEGSKKQEKSEESKVNSAENKESEVKVEEGENKKEESK